MLKNCQIYLFSDIFIASIFLFSSSNFPNIRKFENCIIPFQNSEKYHSRNGKNYSLWDQEILKNSKNLKIRY